MRLLPWLSPLCLGRCWACPYTWGCPAACDRPQANCPSHCAEDAGAPETEWHFTALSRRALPPHSFLRHQPPRCQVAEQEGTWWWAAVSPSKPPAGGVMPGRKWGLVDNLGQQLCSPTNQQCTLTHTDCTHPHATGSMKTCWLDAAGGLSNAVISSPWIITQSASSHLTHDA